MNPFGRQRALDPFGGARGEAMEDVLSLQSYAVSGEEGGGITAHCDNTFQCGHTQFCNGTGFCSVTDVCTGTGTCVNTGACSSGPAGTMACA